MLLVVAGAAACGGNDSPTSPTTIPTTPTTPTTPAVGNLTATLSSIQRELFTPSCAGHHGDHATEADLDLTEGANLVNVTSVQVGLDLVEPNDAENSYLIHKLDGRAGIVGARMPPGGPFITDDALDVVKAWINAGAQNN